MKTLVPWLSLILSIVTSISNAEHVARGSTEGGYFSATPSLGNNANLLDVGKCTALAEGVAVLAWYGPALLEKLGGTATSLNTKLITLTGKSKEFITGVEMIAALVGLKIMPKQWLQWTLQQFWDNVVQPLWQGCKNVGADFATLPASLSTLTATPDFYKAKAYDGIGVKNGRFCAEQNLGFLGFNMFGGGYKGCAGCCNRKLTKSNGLGDYQTSCKAVCHAQFD